MCAETSTIDVIHSPWCFIEAPGEDYLHAFGGGGNLFFLDGQRLGFQAINDVPPFSVLLGLPAKL
jgi:hypothetical protein